MEQNGVVYKNQFGFRSRHTTTDAVSVFCNDTLQSFNNKAIRDGKYIARPMPVLGNVHPIKIAKIDIFS